MASQSVRALSELVQPALEPASTLRFARLGPEEHAMLVRPGLETALESEALCVRIRTELAEQGRLYKCKSGYEWIGRLSDEVWTAVLGHIHSRGRS